MATLNIVSTQPGAGKTGMAGALALHLTTRGRKVAYHKPLSTNPESDPDLAFIGALLEKRGSPQSTVPQPFPQRVDNNNLPTRLSEVRAAEAVDTVKRLESEFDDVLVEWDAPAVPPGSPVLMLHSFAHNLDIGAAASSIAEEGPRYGGDLKGIVANNVLKHRQREVETGLVSALKQGGLPALGAIPEDREMLALSMGQVAQFLGGQWVEEPDDLDFWVDRFLIGGNIMDSGPNYFGRYPNQAVVTRAGRPDIQMASLMCNTKLLVLTGGEEPTEYIRVEAQKRESSLLVVEGDTLEIAESLGSILDLAAPYSEHKLQHFARLAEENLEGGLDGLLA